MAAPPPPPPPPPPLRSPGTALTTVHPPLHSKVPAPPPIKSHSGSRANGPPPPPPIRSGSVLQTQNGVPPPPPSPPHPPTQSHAPPVPQHSPKHKANMISAVPPPPPIRTTPMKHPSSPISSPFAMPPPSPPVLQNQKSSNVPPPPPPIRTTPVKHPSSPISSPFAIPPPPPPVLQNPTPNHGFNVPPPPPTRHSRHSQETPVPPPPPRKSSIKRSSTTSSTSSSTPPHTPSHAPHPPPPPPPPARNETTQLTSALQMNPGIPPPPPVVQQQLSSGSPFHNHPPLQPSLAIPSSSNNQNGYGDYDIPRSTRERNGFQDYDVPLPKWEREAKERAMAARVPGPQLQNSPMRSNSMEKDPGLEGGTPVIQDERGRKEKGYSLLTTKPRPPSDSSSDSRPVSVTSSVYSADASSLSLNSSRSSSKLTIPNNDGEQPDYDIPKPSQNSELSIDHQFEESIDQIFENMADQREKKKLRNGGMPPSDAGESFHLRPIGMTLNESAHSSTSNLDENSSSRSGSNDNLGVWDDISYEEEEEDEEAEKVALVEEMEVGKDGLLLDSWIQELESGIKGMEEVAGLSELSIPSEPTVAITTSDAPPPMEEEVATPVQRMPPESPQVQVEEKVKEEKPVIRRRSKTELKMAQVASWRLSMKAIGDADDPDLDALLADLCQLEEDTKTQLANTTNSTKTTGGDRDTIDFGGPSSLSPTKVMKGGNGGKQLESGMVSSEDFIQFMESLQASKNIILDPSRSLSTATYSAEQNKSAPNEDSSDAPQLEDKESSDIFQADTPAILRHNSRTSVVRQSTLQRHNSRNSSVRKTARPGDISTSQSSLTEPIQSPTHKAVQKELDAFAERLKIEESLTPEQQVQKLKNEKLKIAMMKLKEASVQKMVLKVHNVDGSTKMVAIHEAMNARDVCVLLAERNHQDLGPNWTLVEILTDLHLERVLEDHEKVLDCLTHWPRGHNNHVLFKNNPEKYYLLKRPQMLMPASHSYSSVTPSRSSFTEEQKKNIILKELFKSKILPKLEGELLIRDGKKSTWKKHLFVLRASGLYYSKSGKSLSSKDIVRVVEWKDVECYTGNQYKKFYRAPSNNCFSLVPHGPLIKVEKRIIHICVSTKHDLAAWMTGIRLAKHGVQLQQNYEDMKAEMPWLQLEDENLDILAKNVPKSKPRESKISATDGEPVIMLQNGKEINPQDLAGKKKSPMRGSYQLKVTENGTAPGERETLMIGSGPVISGPLLQDSQTGSLRRNRSNQSVLASVFQNAWKQGTMAAEMNQDTEKWPVFNQTSTKQKSRSHESLAHKDSLPYLEEENSGMFTLKRKKDKEGNGKTTLAPNPQLPRTTSLGSKRDSTESKNRTSHGIIQTTLL